MNSRTIRRQGKTLTARIATASLGLLLTVTSATIAFAQAAQPAPPEITPPSGNTVFLTAHAVGTQNYICLPVTSASGTTTAWTFLGPQATLSVGVGRFVQQVSTHFLSTVPGVSISAEPSCTVSGDGKQLYCPTWESSFDSSAVWGSSVGSVIAGSDPSCPNAGAIPCLLLKAVANKRGHLSSGLFARTTYIQRFNTEGGSAPTGSCNAGALALVPYTANYSFYAQDDEGDSGDPR